MVLPSCRWLNSVSTRIFVPEKHSAPLAKPGRAWKHGCGRGLQGVMLVAVDALEGAVHGHLPANSRLGEGQAWIRAEDVLDRPLQGTCGAPGAGGTEPQGQATSGALSTCQARAHHGGVSALRNDLRTLRTASTAPTLSDVQAAHHDPVRTNGSSACRSSMSSPFRPCVVTKRAMASRGGSSVGPSWRRSAVRFCPIAALMRQ